MRILQIITDTDRRGAQVFASDLHPALVARGHDVRTVALAPGDGANPLPWSVLGRTRLGVPTVRALRRAASGVAVVVAHGSSTLPAAAFALAGTDVPFVYRQISESLFWAGRLDRRLRVRGLLSRAAGVVTLAPSQGAVLHTSFGVPSSRLHVVPNAIPTAAFGRATPDEQAEARVRFGCDPGAVVVLSMGALVPEKGVDVLLDAVHAAGDTVDGLEVLVVGEGPERSALEDRARRIGVDARFAGVVDDARAAYAAADLLVLASQGGDSMPATLIEAGAMALPAVATDVGAIADVVAHGDTGLVVPPGDNAALVDAVRLMVADEARRREFGANARTRVLARFDIDVVAEGWERALVAATGGER